MRDFRTSDRDVAKRRVRARDGASRWSVRNPEEAKGRRRDGEAAVKQAGARGQGGAATGAPCRSPAEANLKLPGLPGERKPLIAGSRTERNLLIARSRSEQLQHQRRTPARSRSEQSLLSARPPPKTHPVIP